MAIWYMVQPDDRGILLVPEFDTAQEADAFANSLNIFGIPTEKSVYFSSPAQQTVVLDNAKQQKIYALGDEGNLRALAVNAAFRTAAAGYQLNESVENNRQTVDGQAWSAVGVAWHDAALVIAGLPSLAAVAAYNVETDPNWP